MDLLPESLPLRFSLAFLIVLGIIGLGAWAVRRFGAARRGGAGARGRQPRLGVIDYASVDARRRLILIRRDNVEHLLMIGGPTDVVVEANIVRAAATGRPTALETSRAIPLPDNGDGSWPLQPESVTPPARPARATPKAEAAAEEAPTWPLQPQADTPSARPQRDTLAALAVELSARPSPPRRMPAAWQSPAPTSADAAAADQSLAEMAHRLEAALRKPGATAEARTPAAPQPQPAAAATEQAAASEPMAPPPPPRMSRPAADPRPAPAAAPKPPQSAPGPQNAESPPNAQNGQSPTLYDNLEQEMASLLGRPTNKS